jgi:hypothetical protein
VGEPGGVAAMWGVYRTIMAAARRGAISPEGALRWARRAASGEPVDVLASLSGPPAEDRRAWMAAAANSDLAQRVLDVLLRLVEQARAAPGDEFAGLFPPSAPLGPDLGAQEYRPQPLIYPGEGKGKRNRTPVTWDGYTQASAPGEMPDWEADLLLPPRTAEEAVRRAQALDVRAAAVEDLSDEDLYRLLFGEGG